jgi:hypothetical protein
MSDEVVETGFAKIEAALPSLDTVLNTRLASSSSFGVRRPPKSPLGTSTSFYASAV